MISEAELRRHAVAAGVDTIENERLQEGAFRVDGSRGVSLISDCR
jgi:hypothetical protein